MAAYFLLSFIGTKFWGLEGTVRLFSRLAKALPTPGKRLSIEQVRARIHRGYSFLPLPIQCLDQAIVSWYLLHRNGHHARLKIGVSLAPLYSHAWVISGDQILGDIAGLADFHVVAEYGELA